jgi:hypothetical protein
LVMAFAWVPISAATSAPFHDVATLNRAKLPVRAVDRPIRSATGVLAPPSGWPYRPLLVSTQATGEVLVGVRRKVECAVADGAPGKLKRLLDTVVEQLLVESRACIQPYFVAPTVRTRIDPRRRTTKHTNSGAPGPSLWVSPRAWGRCG